MRFLQSFKYAFKGIVAAAAGRNLRIQLAGAIIIIATGLYFKIGSDEWIAILICIGGVLSAEMMNTAIEKMADFIHPEKNDKIGQLKDIAAGAVLIWAIISSIVALIIFFPRIFN